MIFGPPSVALPAVGTAREDGETLAKHNCVDPTSKQFIKDLESLPVLLQIAVIQKTNYEFTQIKKCYLDNNGIQRSSKFVMSFEV